MKYVNVNATLYQQLTLMQSLKSNHSCISKFADFLFLKSVFVSELKGKIWYTVADTGGVQIVDVFIS